MTSRERAEAWCTEWCLDVAVGIAGKQSAIANLESKFEAVWAEARAEALEEVIQMGIEVIRNASQQVGFDDGVSAVASFIDDIIALKVKR